MTPLAITVLVLGAAFAGALIGYLLARVRASADLGQTQSELASARTALTMEKEKAAEQLLTQDTRFKQQSQEILEEKSQLFARQNQDSLDKLLVPLKERIEGFEKQVRETRQSEGEARAALIEQIRSLQESSRKSSAVAENLASALKGQSKTQGNWGEMILERILELSGLTRGREYETQFSANTADGERRQPDAVVHLPDQRDIVIDSKVSLTAFVRATEAVDDAARTRALTEHVQSVRTHLQELSAKDYQKLDGIRSLDFVLMFVPSEAAYIEAIRTEPKLFEEALAANIGLVSPSTLLPTLRTVENLWRFEHQSQNATDIADKAGKLYDKFVGLVEDLDKLGRALETTDKAYRGARAKLSEGRGNLVDKAEELKRLGASTRKQLPRSGGTEALPEPSADEEERV